MDDLISRQAAISICDNAIDLWNGQLGTGALVAVRDAIMALPPAQRTGMWKVSYLPKGKMKYCSECGFGQYIADERRYGFCPNCGARMESDSE